MRFKLAKYNGKNRYTCPGCGKRKTFTRYVDTMSGNVEVSPEVGKCDRVNNCGYHLTPFEFRKNGGKIKDVDKVKHVTPDLPLLLDPSNVKHHPLSDCNLFDFMCRTLPVDKVVSAFKTYRVGLIQPDKWRSNGVVFWSINKNGQVCSGKVMGFSVNGKRIKRAITSMHRVLLGDEAEYVIKPCFFGEHLIRKGSVICIVESEKTAIWASIVYPENRVWIAASSMMGLSLAKIKALSGHDVELFPDMGKGVIEWEKKMQVIKRFARSVKINSFILKHNKLEHEGKDLMDFC